MTSRATLNGRQGRFRIVGVLDFDTVPALLAKARQMLDGVHDATVDFTDVTSCNSAGLALLLEMSRIMRARSCTIRFQSIPHQIISMAEAYGLTGADNSLEQILHSQDPTLTP